MKPKAYWNHKKKRGRPRVVFSKALPEVYQLLPHDGSKISAAKLREMAEARGMSFTTLYKNLNLLVDMKLVYREFDTSTYPPPVSYARVAPFYLGPAWQFPETKGKLKTLEKRVKKEEAETIQLLEFCHQLKENYSRIEDKKVKEKAKKALVLLLENAMTDLGKSYLGMLRMVNKIPDENKKDTFVKMFHLLVLSAHDSFLVDLVANMPEEVFDEIVPLGEMSKSAFLDFPSDLRDFLVNELKKLGGKT